MATIDDIINGSFQAVGAKPAYLSQGYNPADYASIYATPTVPTYQPGMLGRGQPARLTPVSAMAATDRLAAGSPGLPLNPTGQYNAGNPFVLSALSAQQGATPAMPTMASRVTGYGTPRAPNLPVTATPELEQAYTDMVAGKPGAQKLYADLLANAAPTMGQKPTTKATGGLASLITGKGTPRASGGLFGLLFGGGASAPSKRTSTATGTGTNGYTYANGQNTGYSKEVQAARAAQGQAIGDANRRNPNPTYSASGENNAFMSRDYQNSVRKQTGY